MFFLLFRLLLYDSKTFFHSFRVCCLSIYMAVKSKMRVKEVYLCGIAGLYHDIGKLKIPKSIINKPASLTKEERKIIAQHATWGYDILQKYSNNEMLKQIVLLHHGTKNVNNRERTILTNAFQYSELIRTADIFDALTSNRPYHKAVKKEKALDILKENHVPSRYITILYTSQKIR